MEYKVEIQTFYGLDKSVYVDADSLQDAKAKILEKYPLRNIVFLRIQPSVMHHKIGTDKSFYKRHAPHEKDKGVMHSWVEESKNV